MQIKNYISNTVPCLSLTDSGANALDLMEQYQLSELPLVEEDRFLGLVAEQDILDLEDTFLNFAEVQLPYVLAAIQSSAHILEAAKLLQQYQTKVIAVLDEKNKYIGCITADACLKYLTIGAEAAESGGIIVLEMKQNNYSLSQIARICESENVSILSVLTHAVPETDLIRVTLKLNRTQLSAIIATFERLQYEVTEIHAADSDAQDLQKNYDALMHYLNI